MKDQLRDPHSGHPASDGKHLSDEARRKVMDAADKGTGKFVPWEGELGSKVGPGDVAMDRLGGRPGQGTPIEPGNRQFQRKRGLA